jgi:hypothetical protein
MLTKPFNGEKLWVGTMLNNTNSQITPKPPMVLPEVNWLTGQYKPPRPSISEEMNYNYSLYSAAYWNGVRMRQEKYRQNVKDRANQSQP